MCPSGLLVNAFGEKILLRSGIIAEKLIVSPLERGAPEGGGVCRYSPPETSNNSPKGATFSTSTLTSTSTGQWPVDSSCLGVLVAKD